MRGVIRNRELAAKIRDFSGLRFGKITPTDIDAFLDFGDKLFVIIEGKSNGAPVTFGQRLALERLADACHCPPKRKAYAMIVDQPIDAGDVDYANTRVREIRCGNPRKWQTPKRVGITTKQAIDSLLAELERGVNG